MSSGRTSQSSDTDSKRRDSSNRLKRKTTLKSVGSFARHHLYANATADKNVANKGLLHKLLLSDEYKYVAVRETAQAFLLFLVGVLFYHFNERVECSTGRSNATSTDDCHCDPAYVHKHGAFCTRPWDWEESVYFVMVTISTVS